MTLSGITLNDKVYTVDEIRDGQFVTADATLTENARNTLKFCQQWLTGQREFLVNTSGSTGKPKQITLTRQQMEISARLTGNTLGLHAGQRALVCLPTRYIAGRMMLVRGFVLGMALTVVEPASDPLATLPAGATFDFTALIPLQLQTLLDGPPVRQTMLNYMSAILVGGGPVSVAQHQQLQSVTAPIYHTYGMTETVTHIALRRLNGPDASPAFSPLKGVQLGMDERRCLTIKSAVTQGGILHTNDSVELRADGSFLWLGRWDNVINTGGVKVQVEKVERVLEQVLLQDMGNSGHTNITHRRFFIGPLPDTRLGQLVAVIMEGKPLPQVMEKKIHGALGEHLEVYEVPRQFYYQPQFIETPTGKIDRPAILDQLENQQ